MNSVHPVVPPPVIFSVPTIMSVAGEAIVGLALGLILQVAFTAPLVASELIGGSMG